jgi:hypothetical protein
VEHTPNTQEGFELWDVITKYDQLRFSPDGTVIGFDILQIVTLSNTLGYNSPTLLMLIPYAQQGLCAAVDKIKKENK